MAYEGSVILTHVSGVGGFINIEGSLYILADGRSLPKSTYPALYAVVSGRYGQTVSDFFIPDLRGYYLRGNSLNSNRDQNYTSRVLYGPNATASGVGTYQPSAMFTHVHYNRGSQAPSNSNYIGNVTTSGFDRVFSNAALTETTSGVTPNSFNSQLVGFSGVGVQSGVFNPPSFSYYAYIKAS